MAVFGAPVAHDDDAERAVRAALDLQRCAVEHTEEFGGLSLRVGVNTGEMMFAPVGPDREYTASATPSTWRPGSRRQPRREECSWATRPPEPPGPFAMSPSHWERVVAERAPHLVTILGAPGVGKTRLYREFAHSVRAAGGRALHGRSLPYGERTGYGAFAQQVRGVAGVFETDPAPVASAKLAQAIRALLPAPGAVVVANQLAQLIGLPSAGAAADKGALLLETAGGNPLFLEELGNSFAERATEITTELPRSLETTIAARLDALPAGERQVLLDASVCGRIFWSGAIRCLRASVGLDQLLRAEGRRSRQLAGRARPRRTSACDAGHGNQSHRRGGRGGDPLRGRAHGMARRRRDPRPLLLPGESG